MLRTLGMMLFITFLGLCAWGGLAILFHGLGGNLPLFGNWHVVLTWQAGPPALFLTSLYGWSAARSWRVMSATRYSHSPLGRGGAIHRPATQSKSGLEWICLQLILLSLLSFPVWLRLEPISVWLITILLLLWLRRKV
ncbi:MAG: hypothetical protein AAGI03_05140 [Pseudomonadota bacterium]